MSITRDEVGGGGRTVVTRSEPVPFFLLHFFDYAV